MSNEDLFKLDSGLRESMDLTIHMAYFATNADYQGGVPWLLYLTGSDESGDPVEMFMSVGADWSSADGGASITHPTKKFINKSTIYGHWLRHALEIPELREVLVNRDGGPTTAAIWNNLILHLDLVEIKFGKNVDPVERLMPTGFLGVYDENAQVPQAPATPPVAPPAAPVPAPAPVQQPTTPLTAPTPTATVPSGPTPQERVAAAQAQAAVASNGGSPLYNEMVELAKASPDFQTFMTTAFSRSDVLADESLAIQVAEDGPGGIWAATH
jgi:hypothetical protein